MTKTHWKKQFNYDYLGSYSLEDIDKDLIVTIKTTSKEMVTGNSGKKEECFLVYFNEFQKALICNRTNAKNITKVVGSPYVEDWTGTKVSLYVEKGVKAFGDTTDALRIRPIAPRIEVDTQAYKDSLEACSNLEELKAVWLEIPAQVRTPLETFKNELKTKLS